MDLAVTIEEDEELFLRSSFNDRLVAGDPSLTEEVYERTEEDDNGAMVVDHRKDSCLFSQPMKGGVQIDTPAEWKSPVFHELYPLHQLEWEDEIVWGDSSPILVSHGSSPSSVISEHDSDPYTNLEKGEEITADNKQGLPTVPDNHCYLSDADSVDPPVIRDLSEKPCMQSMHKNYHPKIRRLDSRFEVDESTDAKTPKVLDEICSNDTSKRFRKLTLQNKEFFEGNWLDQVIWDPSNYVPKPKLIFDLQDEQMLFEVLDPKDVGHLRSHAGAMIMNHLSKSSTGYSFDLSSQSGGSIGRFNISNDKYYSNRKTSQQSKSHAKKRAVHGLKVLHSVPALKLQTMKPKLSK